MKKAYEKPEIFELRFDIQENMANIPDASAGFEDGDYDPDDIG